jgi:NAD(P)H-dependent flavin oxidoreductase YrpB (nitropropane dioxygenase family)
MKLPSLTIGKRTVRLPLIQGGMSVRVSTSSLASAVAREGAIGVIGGSGIPPKEIYEDIKKAKANAGDGLIGVNIMFVANEYTQLVEASIAAEVDLIITGAGFSRDIYKYGKDSGIPIVSIVSSDRLAKTAEKCGADAIIVEGFEAGGHLGTDRSTIDVIPEVLRAVDHTPVIAAGGIANGMEWAAYMKMGCAGVQIATRFILTDECDVADEYKQLLLHAGPEDVIVFQSPAGLPAHAIRNAFMEKVLAEETGKTICAYNCMKHCSKRFCLLSSLNRAQKGDVEHGVVFTGSNVGLFNEILPVKTVIERLVKEAESVDN